LYNLPFDYLYSPLGGVNNNEYNMPQIDIYIVVSQLQFLLFFFIGYFFFLKKILPLISLEMKFRQKVLLFHMNWFTNNINQVVFYKKAYSTLLVRFKLLLEIFNFIIKKRNIFYGIYDIDLMLVRFQYKQIK